MDDRTIEAIKSSIRDKWNPICMGCGVDTGGDNCPLCKIFINNFCEACPLAKKFNVDCFKSSSVYQRWNCSPCDHDTGTAECPVCGERAEAMLEALVQLLPEEHRAEFGG